jgi:hypothetical protein
MTYTFFPCPNSLAFLLWAKEPGGFSSGWMSTAGKFIAKDIEPGDIREKLFRYSCKADEFRQIFDNNPDDASSYAKNGCRAAIPPMRCMYSPTASV